MQADSFVSKEIRERGARGIRAIKLEPARNSLAFLVGKASIRLLKNQVYFLPPKVCAFTAETRPKTGNFTRLKKKNSVLISEQSVEL